MVTSFSTVAVAFGAPSVFTFGDAVRLLKEGALELVALVSGVTAVKLDVDVVGGVATSVFVTAGDGVALFFSGSPL
jgi:class 3 adenylate cyclase